VGREIDIFETQIELRKKARSRRAVRRDRLRRAAYGQRMTTAAARRRDHAGALFPVGRHHQGTDDLLDAPGMQRIKIPFGRMTAAQLDVLADLPRRTPTGSCTFTTRQDFSCTSLHIDDTPT